MLAPRAPSGTDLHACLPAEPEHRPWAEPSLSEDGLVAGTGWTRRDVGRVRQWVTRCPLRR
jgi:hypothetical protein